MDLLKIKDILLKILGIISLILLISYGYINYYNNPYNNIKNNYVIFNIYSKFYLMNFGILLMYDNFTLIKCIYPNLSNRGYGYNKIVINNLSYEKYFALVYYKYGLCAYPGASKYCMGPINIGVIPLNITIGKEYNITIPTIINNLSLEEKYRNIYYNYCK